jgi:hypothetical protein
MKKKISKTVFLDLSSSTNNRDVVIQGDSHNFPTLTKFKYSQQYVFQS